MPRAATSVTSNTETLPTRSFPTLILRATWSIAPYTEQHDIPACMRTCQPLHACKLHKPTRTKTEQLYLPSTKMLHSKSESGH